MKKFALVIMLAALLLAGNTSAQAGVDPKLPEYKPVAGISGSLISVGSDTLNNMMTLWAEGFRSLYPAVTVEIRGAGSSTAPPALTEGTANFGPMSRPMRTTEVEMFEKKFGYKPTQVSVAIDAVAAVVNKDNPLKCLSIPQLDAIFSVTRACGHPEDITSWGGVGLTGAWAARDFTIFGRSSASGTYGFFKDNALCDGDYKPTISEMPGSASLVLGVAEAIGGIGYTGMGYITPGVKPLALSETTGGVCFEPSAENAIAGNYPLARMLVVYVNKNPVEPLTPMEREFLRFILSRQGQEIVVRDGAIPLPEPVAAQMRQMLAL